MRSCSMSETIVRILIVGLPLMLSACGNAIHDEVVGEAQSALEDPAADALYVGDAKNIPATPAGTNAVQQFLLNGEHLGAFVEPGSDGLNQPTGLVFRRMNINQRGHLLVANQNVLLPVNGEVKLYNGFNGAPLPDVVDQDDLGAPFNPQGIVLGQDGILYLADTSGRLATYDGTTGAFLGDLPPTGFTGSFRPRAVVFGDDGKLYVSVRNAGNLGGAVLRFDTATRTFLDVFVDSATCGCHLNRPQGLVFGPDRKLYLTSFQADSTDIDRILIFDQTGTYQDEIPLGGTGAARAFAQALIFGPGGKLFVPITGGGVAPFITGDAGSVRRYDINAVGFPFDVFVPSHANGGPLERPVFATFCNTDPATLVYNDGASANPARCWVLP